MSNPDCCAPHTVAFLAQGSRVLLPSHRLQTLREELFLSVLERDLLLPLHTLVIGKGALLDAFLSSFSLHHEVLLVEFVLASACCREEILLVIL